MKLFFDTSAFIKLFIEEQGSSAVRMLVNDYKNELFALHLIRLESLSAVNRRARIGEISYEMMQKFSKSMDEVLFYWHIEPLTEVVLNEAESLITRYGFENGLRSLDALHLSAFTMNAEEDWRFVCADERLCVIAKSLGYEIINPSKE